MTPKIEKAWDVALKALIPVVIALSGWGIRQELQSADHDLRILRLEKIAEERAAESRLILAQLNDIKVLLARLEERLAANGSTGR